MYPLIETIKLEDGIIQNLEYHQERMNHSMDELFPNANKIELSKELSAIQIIAQGVFKVRVLYGPSLEKIEVESYTYRSVNSLKVVYHPHIDYHLKYADRHILNLLFSQRENCDDILIVKNDFVTDSFAANLVFYDGKTWFTPNTPLLKGTKRQLLLNQELIFEKEIKVNDIVNYQKVGLINAMIDFDKMPLVQINAIQF